MAKISFDELNAAAKDISDEIGVDAPPLTDPKEILDWLRGVANILSKGDDLQSSTWRILGLLGKSKRSYSSGVTPFSVDGTDITFEESVQ